MSTYAIGDVQGCFSQLEKLLENIQYDRKHDTLWFTGDLINRGPESLRTLRFISTLPESTIAVLGNHDLTLLAAASGTIMPQHGDTYEEILHAPDRDILIDWLKNRPFMYYDPQLQFTICHAGIYPLWSLAQAQEFAKEAETLVQSPHSAEALHAMFGNYPTIWKPNLTGWGRFRFIVNAFTRMRFCDTNGTLDLNNKSEKTNKAGYLPWFSVPFRKTTQDKLIFGHWAALQGRSDTARVYALDTGCVWGDALTAMCLETEQFFQISCHSE